MITWPSILPNPSNDFSAEANPGTIRTQMDSGRYRQRPRFTGEHEAVNVTWLMTDYEFGVFKAIHKHQLFNGSDWFMCSLPMGDGLKAFKVRFLEGKYAAKHVPVLHWRVTATLETEDDTSPHSAEAIEALAAVGYDIDAFELAVAGLTEVTHL
jgi:hypothetical protein